MNDLVKLAVSKAFEKETKNFKAAPGSHEIDEMVILRIKGSVVKSEDVLYTPTVEIPLLPTLAIVLEKAGFQRENAKKLIQEAMVEAINNAEKAEDYLAERLKDIETAMSHVKEITAALPKKTKSGATRVQVEVEQVLI